MLSFFSLDVLGEIWDLIESVSEGFPTYSYDFLHFNFIVHRTANFIFIVPEKITCGYNC